MIAWERHIDATRDDAGRFIAGSRRRCLRRRFRGRLWLRARSLDRDGPGGDGPWRCAAGLAQPSYPRRLGAHQRCGDVQPPLRRARGGARHAGRRAGRDAAGRPIPHCPCPTGSAPIASPRRGCRSRIAAAQARAGALALRPCARDRSISIPTERPAMRVRGSGPVRRASARAPGRQSELGSLPAARPRRRPTSPASIAVANSGPTSRSRMSAACSTAASRGRSAAAGWSCSSRSPPTSWPCRARARSTIRRPAIGLWRSVAMPRGGHGGRGRLLAGAQPVLCAGQLSEASLSIAMEIETIVLLIRRLCFPPATGSCQWSQWTRFNICNGTERRP